ncbi:hypothetical protein ARTHRO8AJ_410078 [Arthrobacter sp. 8AJ]|nr:hypothetical protein ARTHRO8AJ_410078 [Arthrobacter sp. 8AJ]
MVRAEPCSHLKGGRVPVNSNHFAAEGLGDHDGAEPHAACPDDGNPFIGFQAGPASQRTVGSGEPASQAGGCLEADALGNCHEIGVRRVDHHLPGKRTPVREARLLLLRANLCVAAEAPLARATALDERCGNPVAGRPLRHSRANTGNDTGEFVARDMRQRYIVMSCPGMPVAAAEPRRNDADDDAAHRHLRLSNLPDGQRPCYLVQDNRAHMTSTYRRCAARVLERLRPTSSHAAPMR